MSDYELVSLFNEYITIVFTVFMGHCSLIFAFLIASFLVAHRLRTSMATVVILLFTFAIFATTFVQNRFGGAMAGLAKEMRRAVNEGESSIGWHSITYEPEIYMAIFMHTLTTLMVLSYIGSVAFFFIQRKSAASQESGTNG